MHVLEFTLPMLDENFELIVLDEKTMGANHGFAKPTKGIIALREDVYYGAIDGNPRDLMTAAHELGHLLLHHETHFMRTSADVPLRAFEDSEWQANCFAGELLVPANIVASECESINEVMELFGVSREAAKVQTKAFQKEGLINWS
ncbi:ImmA/IrrE family metallo-endopeptidase [Aliidiomarina halalkaliphila]|uniref:ImmA/IrrE family metallo-endopeptidase n=2 Tax=Aliidiomarina halalkaliphila TaxID=2593535 RepID=A0A552X1Z0_9GAMM|nr:ImmA/IrrE family metallo-endopeptidase [Aliidiomarina halalkaliphila]